MCSKLKQSAFLFFKHAVHPDGKGTRREEWWGWDGVLKEGTSRSEAEGNRGEERKRGPERGE